MIEEGEHAMPDRILVAYATRAGSTARGPSKHARYSGVAAKPQPQ
jgi:hypothetical protein